MLFSLLFIERRNQDRRENQTLGLIFKPIKKIPIFKTHEIFDYERAELTLHPLLRLVTPKKYAKLWNSCGIHFIKL